MSQRHLARSLILQILYSLDYIPGDDAHVSAVTSYCISEFGGTFSDDAFVFGVVEGVVKKQQILDEIIAKAAPQWPLESMNPVERCILRMGLYEMIFGDYANVPPKVAINEAVEIAKAFSTPSAKKFVNGILGAVYKEIGEPGKEQSSKTHDISPEDYEKLPVDQKAGGIIYAMHNGQIHFAMVHDVFGYWTVSKGSIEAGETPEEACIREISEETGLKVEVVTKLGENEYVANHPTDGRIRKHVHYFLTKAEYSPITLHSETGGLIDGKWFQVGDIVELRMYDDVTKLMTVSIEKILTE